VHGKDLVLLKRSGYFVFPTKGDGSFSEPDMLPHTGKMILFLFIFMHLQFLPLSVQVLSYSMLEYTPQLLPLTFRRRDLNTPVQCHHAEIFRAGF